MPPPPASPTFSGDDVRRIRSGLGLSQDEFAGVLGYSRGSYVSELEKGHREVTPTLARLLSFVERYGAGLPSKDEGGTLADDLDELARLAASAAQRARGEASQG